MATKEETIRTINKLLTRRKKFMQARNLRDGDSGCVADRYLFTHTDREQLMAEWKEEFHAGQDQVLQQKRDSWKPHGRPEGADGEWGRNSACVRQGKHSRFHRHLQIEAGSKTMAELIIFAGRYDPEFLNKAHLAKQHSSASQPAAGTAVQKHLKRAAATAKLEYRKTLMLCRRLEHGDIDVRHLGWKDQQNLQALQDGLLLERLNHAIAAYGHGTLRNERVGEALQIGGSTGGLSRLLLDGYAEPDVNTFLARR